MNFLSFLKTIGHDLTTIGTDIEKGLEAVAPILALIPGVSPSLGEIISGVEAIVNGLIAAGAAITSSQVTQITQSTAQVAGLNAAARLASRG